MLQVRKCLVLIKKYNLLGRNSWKRVRKGLSKGRFHSQSAALYQSHLQETFYLPLVPTLENQVPSAARGRCWGPCGHMAAPGLIAAAGRKQGRNSGRQLLEGEAVPKNS